MTETTTGNTPAKPQLTDKDADGKARFATYDEYYEALALWTVTDCMERRLPELVEQKVREFFNPDGSLRKFVN